MFESLVFSASKFNYLKVKTQKVKRRVSSVFFFYLSLQAASVAIGEFSGVFSGGAVSTGLLSL